jgi:hypothetical protein
VSPPEVEPEDGVVDPLDEPLPDDELPEDVPVPVDPVPVVDPELLLGVPLDEEVVELEDGSLVLVLYYDPPALVVSAGFHVKSKFLLSFFSLSYSSSQAIVDLVFRHSLIASWAWACLSEATLERLEKMMATQSSVNKLVLIINCILLMFIVLPG